MDEAETQTNNLEHKEAKKNNHTEQEENKIQKNEDSINSLWDKFKKTNILLIGVPEGKDKEQEIANPSEKIMKENFSNLVKEIDMQIQEAQKSPKQDGCKEAHSKTHHY